MAEDKTTEEIILELDERLSGISDDYYGYYNMEGEKIPLKEWSDLFRNNDARHVGDTTKNGYRISTVLLGINHNFGGGGEPLIFETMIFKGNGSSELYMERYATKDQAEAGHKYAVENLERILKGRDYHGDV